MTDRQWHERRWIDLTGTQVTERVAGTEPDTVTRLGNEWLRRWRSANTIQEGATLLDCALYGVRRHDPRIVGLLFGIARKNLDKYEKYELLNPLRQKAREVLKRDLFARDKQPLAWFPVAHTLRDSDFLSDALSLWELGHSAHPSGCADFVRTCLDYFWRDNGQDEVAVYIQGALDGINLGRLIRLNFSHPQPQEIWQDYARGYAGRHRRAAMLDGMQAYVGITIDIRSPEDPGKVANLGVKLANPAIAVAARQLTAYYVERKYAIAKSLAECLKEYEELKARPQHGNDNAEWNEAAREELIDALHRELATIPEI